MAGAIIAIDQDRPSGSSPGSAGVARNDLWVNRAIHPRCTTSGNTAFAWVFLDKPPGSAASIANGDQISCDFTPDLPGSYRLQLTTNAGGPGNVQVLIAGVTNDVSGNPVGRSWLIPALGESVGEDNFAGNTRGWDKNIVFILTDILNYIQSGGGAGALVLSGDTHGPAGSTITDRLRGATVPASPLLADVFRALIVSAAGAYSLEDANIATTIQTLLDWTKPFPTKTIKRIDAPIGGAHEVTSMRITLPDVGTHDIELIALAFNGGNSMSIKRSRTYYRSGGAPTELGTADPPIVRGVGGYAADIVIANTNDVSVNVTGDINTTWYLTMQVTQGVG